MCVRKRMYTVTEQCMLYSLLLCTTNVYGQIRTQNIVTFIAKAMKTSKYHTQREIEFPGKTERTIQPTSDVHKYLLL